MQIILETMNGLFGVAWMPAMLIMALGLFDVATGSFLYQLYMAFIDHDNYPSLWDKYHDKEREIFREEREYAYSNYKVYFSEMLRERQFRKAWNLRRTYHRWDYLELYFQEMAWDGSEFYQRLLERKWFQDTEEEI